MVSLATRCDDIRSSIKSLRNIAIQVQETTQNIKYIVTLQQGVQGDGCPPAGARGVLAHIPLVSAPPQAARERYLKSYSTFDHIHSKVKGNYYAASR
jgi:hypothetical protein